jgi:hypothetical protein
MKEVCVMRLFETLTLITLLLSLLSFFVPRGKRPAWPCCWCWRISSWKVIAGK